ncbi:MAG: flagellar motor protein MotB [Acidobacteriota bacterium]
MARKKRQPEHENHERWLVSYADFITLLFAFFVVMFASSHADKGKAQQVSDSVKKALEGQNFSAMVASVLGGAVDKDGQGSAMKKGPGGTETSVQPRTEKDRREQQLSELLPSLRVLSNELSEEIKAGQIKISMEDRGLVVSFAQAALFPSGEDVISAEAFDGIGKVATAIALLPNSVRLEGHTDSRPINTARFHSNWDLSAARAIALLKILTERFSVSTHRISVAGYADTAPVAPNDTEEGRGRNRRVDIIILNEQGMKGEPLKLEAKSPAP